MSKRGLNRILRAATATPWAILPEKLEAIIGLLELRASGAKLSKAEIQARIGDGRRGAPASGGAVAVLPLYGVVAHRMNAMNDVSAPGGTSTEMFGQAFDKAMSDPNVAAIVIDIDSPGGSVEGVPELAAKIAAARGSKPIVAVANAMAASAAYWLAAAADEIVVTPSGLVGSIGVYQMHVDASEAVADEGLKVTYISAGKYKTEGNPHEPLSDEALAATQGMVDEFYGMFVKAVAKYRGVSVSDVTGGYGEGRVLTAKAAVAAGLADRVATLDETIARVGSGRQSAGRARADAIALPLVAGADVQSDGMTVSLTYPNGTATSTLFGSMDSTGAITWAVPNATATIHAPSITPATAAPEDAATAVLSVLEPAPKAKESSMSEQLAATGAATEPAESRETALANIAKTHPEHAHRLAGWVLNGTTKAEALEMVAANYRDKDKENHVSTGTPHVTGMTDNEAKRPWGSLGEQLIAIARHQSPNGAFPGAGQTDPRLFAAASGGSATVGADGGFLIGKDSEVDLMKGGFETGVLASKCSETEISGNSDSLEVVYIDETSRATGSRWGGVQVYRHAESDTVTAKKPGLGKWECRLEDMMGLAYATERLLADASAMGSVFDEAFRDEFGFKLDDEIYRGTGAGQALGILNAGCLVTVTKETSQVADTIVAENLMKMWARVPLRSRLAGFWTYNIECEPQLQQMNVKVKNVAGTENVGGFPIFTPANGTNPVATIYGRPALPIEHASAIGDVGDIAFLDLSQYKLIRKGGIGMDESIHVRFIYNERAFRWTARVNGAPKLKSAITPYKGANTLSPFVVLQAR
jgi:HK97 family phage major capsid protein